MSLRRLLQTEPEILSHLDLAADARLSEARQLAVSGEPHASVYLAGYSAEMTLKLAALRVQGTRPYHLVKPRLAPLASQAKLLIGDVDHEGYHSVKFWALLLRELRRSKGLTMDASLAREVVARSLRIYENWDVSMRYRPRLVSVADAKKVLEDVGWLRNQSSKLWS